MNIFLGPASVREADTAAKLTFMAYHVYSYDIFGHVGEEAATEYFRRLWLHGNNRFGFRFSYIAELHNRCVGLITCYPSPLIKELVGPTIRQLFWIGKGAFIWHFIRHMDNFYYFSNNQEIPPDEFYIATLAVLPECRGLGIGGRLLRYAHELAQENGYNKCTLHVNAENERGIRFYEQNGFVKAPPLEHHPSYFRMIYTI